MESPQESPKNIPGKKNSLTANDNRMMEIVSPRSQGQNRLVMESKSAEYIRDNASVEALSETAQSKLLHPIGEHASLIDIVKKITKFDRPDLLKNKRLNHHLSMELLHTQQVASKQKSVFEEGGPRSDVNRQVRGSNMIKSSSQILGGSMHLSTFEGSSSVNYLNIRTGYKPQKLNIPSFDDGSNQIGEDTATSQTGYRDAGITPLNTECIDSAYPNKLASAKTFREWYLLMLNCNYLLILRS